MLFPKDSRVLVQLCWLLVLLLSLFHVTESDLDSCHGTTCKQTSFQDTAMELSDRTAMSLCLSKPW